MTPTYVADTHALLWYLADSPRLGSDARSVFKQAQSGQAKVIVPAIVLAEAIWVVQKGRVGTDVQRVITTIREHYRITPLEPSDVLRLPDLMGVPEMHDRLIVAETLRRSASLITRDEQIISSGIVPVVW